MRPLPSRKMQLSHNDSTLTNTERNRCKMLHILCGTEVINLSKCTHSFCTLSNVDLDVCFWCQTCDFACVLEHMLGFLFMSEHDVCVCVYLRSQAVSWSVRSTWFICLCHAGQQCRKLLRSSKLNYHLNACVN